MMSMTLPASACSSNNNDSPAQEEEMPAEVTERTILVAYFSWGGTTKQVAENIASHTGGTLFRIETVTPYPIDYTECTVVARQEKDNGVRPELKTRVENLDRYDTIFVGCPVWWWTTPMAIVSFLEDTGYDFSGKTVVPFCTYESTYRDETLAKIVELTPDSKHLKGFGTTDRDADVTTWLTEIGIALTTPAEPENPENPQEPEEPEKPAATEGTIDMSQTVNSAILGGAQRYTIYLPPSYNSNPERSYPVLYLLHGLGQNYRSWASDGDLKAIADNAMTRGASDEMIIVCPEAYATFYVNGYYQGMNYEDYFINEFIPAIESTYRVKADKGGRSISGLSMGGYGSTYHAFRRPEMFGSCFAMSSAYTGTYTQVGTLVVGKTDAELAAFPAFVMECGTEDFAALPMNNNVNNILSQTSLVYTYTTRPGRHDWAFWQECLPKALKLASDNFN